MQINYQPFQQSLPRPILLIEDNAQRSNRQTIPGIGSGSGEDLTINIHYITQSKFKAIGKKKLRLEKDEKISVAAQKAILALELIDSTVNKNDQSVLIVSNSSYGCNPVFIEGLIKRNLNYTVEVRPSTKFLTKEFIKNKVSNNQIKLYDLAKDLIESNILEWVCIDINEPTAIKPVKYLVAQIKKTYPTSNCLTKIFLAQRGGIQGVHPSTIFGITSLLDADWNELLFAIGWARWIRPLTRRKERRERLTDESDKKLIQNTSLSSRPNITLSRQKDAIASFKGMPQPALGGVLRSKWPNQINIAELFAGAGGMGLGFLLANNGENPFHLIYSGEVNPIYVQTLNYNHKVISKFYYDKKPDFSINPVLPLDLRETKSFDNLKMLAEKSGGIQILIGGPPCQGFSTSNRNSGGVMNPHNRLIDTFMDYVEYIKPAIFLMENVQGIIWAKNKPGGKELLIDYFTNRMTKAGYIVSKQLLDAVWYGVPQFRYRFFALGIHRDLGYRLNDFGEWGAFPYPTYSEENYITIRQAISDLPETSNGNNQQQMSYTEINHGSTFLQFIRQGAEPGIITDHVTSRHADYVIERFKAISEGENWQAIKDKMTNYADIDRTHSNIYRRLKWDDPSITIGHYRKSMLIHPSQPRGLSLREAARLQSFPDWFKFAGRANGIEGGLMHKQQQLANAVCPLMTKAVAEYILRL